MRHCYFCRTNVLAFVLGLSVCTALLISGCDSLGSEESSDSPGILFLSVQDARGNAIANAQISADPALEAGSSSGQFITDDLGTVTIRNVAPGEYTLLATLPDYGSGKTVALVKSEEVASADVTVLQGVFESFGPEVRISAPGPSAGFAPGEEITFEANVEDNETPARDLGVTWSSQLDGELNTDAPSASGRVSFSTTALSRGEHVVTLSVTDGDDRTSTDIVRVSTLYPRAVEVSAERQEAGVQLDWTSSQSPAFARYEVRRFSESDPSGGFLVAEILQQETTSFLDMRPPLTQEAGYTVTVVNSDEYARASTEQVVEFPGGLTLSFDPHDVLIHPNRSLLYLLDRSESNSRVVVADYESMEVVRSKTLEGRIGYMDLKDSGEGLELYAPSSDGWVYIYDASDLSRTGAISTGIDNVCVVADGRGHLYVSMRPSPWWERPIRTYDRASGAYIDGGGDFDGDRMRLLPNGTEMISISTGVSPTDMEYFRFNEDATFNDHQDDSYHGDHPLRASIFRASPSGEYVITSSRGAVYSADGNMTYKGQLQHGGLSYSDYAFNEDGGTIYAATSDRKSVQVGSYPSLERTGEIPMRGYPDFLFRRGDRLVSVSKPSTGARAVGIEVTARNTEVEERTAMP